MLRRVDYSSLLRTLISPNGTTICWCYLLVIATHSTRATKTRQQGAWQTKPKTNLTNTDAEIILTMGDLKNRPELSQFCDSLSSPSDDKLSIRSCWSEQNWPDTVPQTTPKKRSNIRCRIIPSINCQLCNANLQAFWPTPFLKRNHLFSNYKSTLTNNTARLWQICQIGSYLDFGSNVVISNQFKLQLQSIFKPSNVISYKNDATVLYPSGYQQISRKLQRESCADCEWHKITQTSIATNLDNIIYRLF